MMIDTSRERPRARSLAALVMTALPRARSLAALVMTALPRARSLAALVMTALPRARSLASLVMTAVVACSKQAPQQVPVVPVRVAAAQQIAAPLTIAANGVVEPLQTVSVQAQVGGTLNEVAFQEGDEVQAGQVLFRL